MTKLNRIALCRALVAVTASVTAVTAAGQNYESLGNLKAGEFAPAALLTGPFHTVDESVTVTGAQPDFTIRSKYGTWVARGHEMLVIRVSELPAFEQLEKISKMDEFLKSAGKPVVATVQVVGDFVSSPIETTGNLFSGLGLFANRIGRVADQSVASVGDKPSANTPAETPILKPVAPPLGTAAPRASISDILGYNDERRSWAKRLKVDPYTFNGALSDKIGEYASVTFGGSFPVNTALGVVIAPLHYAQLTNSAAIAEASEMPPIDIEARNEARLKAMGIEGLPVRNFFRNNFFTPTLQTALVLALESLGNVAGRGEVIALARHAASEIEARYVNNSILLLAQYGRTVAPLAGVRGAGNVIAGQTADGKLIIPAPLDYVPWVAQLDDLARRPDLTGSERWLLVSGRVTPRARQELTALGWSVTDDLAAAK